MVQKFSEKFSSTGSGGRKNIGGIAIIICQHLLLLASLYLVAGGIFIFANAKLETSTMICTSLTIGTACLSTSYVGCHNFASYLLIKTSTERKAMLCSRFRRLSRLCIRLVMVACLVACGLLAVFTMAQHPSCSSGRHSNNEGINTGSVCYVQRSSVAAGLLALVLSLVLFVLVCRVEEPYRYHLWGTVKTDATLPFLLPYRASDNRAAFSEMSFKCRSSTSLSSKTLVHSCSDSKTTLIPAQPEKSGLGIYAPTTKPPSFLAPRPSLSSIRSYTEAISEQPSALPLPPLPTYQSKHRKENSTCTFATIPSRPVRYKGLQRKRTLRIVPPSPVLSVANLNNFNQSQVSLSSIYSQDASGRRYSMRTRMPSKPPAGFCKPYDSSNPLIGNGQSRTIRLVDHAETCTNQEARIDPGPENLDAEINDAATLQAKLPNVRGVSTFGSVEEWSCGSKARAHYYQRLIQSNEAGCRRTLSFRPLMVRKTRNSPAVHDIV